MSRPAWLGTDGNLAFTDSTAAAAWATANPSLVYDGLLATIGGSAYIWTSGAWVAVGGDTVATPAIPLFSPPAYPTDIVDPLALSFKRQGMKSLFWNSRLLVAEINMAKDPTLNLGNQLPVTAIVGTAMTKSYSSGALTIANASGAIAESAFEVFALKPFCAIDVDVTSQSVGSACIELVNGADRLVIAFKPSTYTGGGPNQISYEAFVSGVSQGNVSSGTCPAGPYTIRIQVLGNEVVVGWVKSGAYTPFTIINTSQWWDFRNKSILNGWKVRVSSRCSTAVASSVVISRIEQFFDCGAAQADPRIACYEDGTPICDNGEYILTMTCRGASIRDAYQGCFTFRPDTFEVKFRGVIVFDRGDGVLRNDNAGYMMYDRIAKLWRYLTIGHSDHPGTRYNYTGVVSQDPRSGFVVVPVTQMSISGSYTLYEDMYSIFDADLGKWIATASGDASVSVRLTADSFDGPYTQTHAAGSNETGNQIVKFGSNRVALAGTAGTTPSSYFAVRSYATMSLLGHLSIDILPVSSTGTRTWPCVIPAFDGSAWAWYLLTFDRTQPNGTYSYGNLYLYKA